MNCVGRRGGEQPLSIVWGVPAARPVNRDDETERGQPVAARFEVGRHAARDGFDGLHDVPGSVRLLGNGAEWFGTVPE